MPVSGNKIIFLGIIDYLQYYNLRKRAETLLKSFHYKSSDISAVPPATYAKRFYSFIESIVE